MINVRFTDGTSTYALNNAFVILNMDELTAEIKASDTETPTLAGGERFQTAWTNVDQIIEVLYTGDYSQFFATVRAIENMLNRAAERQSNKGIPAVYLERQIDPTDRWYRTEVIHGRVQYDPRVLHYPWPKAPIHFYIHVRRRYYWETSDLVTLYASSLGVARTQSAISLYNHTDAGHANYVDVLGSDVEGSLPAPVTVVHTNVSGATISNPSELWIARNVNANPTSFNHILEGEAATSAYSPNVIPGSPDLATYSGGYANQKTLSGTSAPISQWQMTTAQLTYAASQYFHVMLRLVGNPEVAKKPWFQLKWIYSLAELWVGPKVYVTKDSELIDLGVLRLPPWLQGVEAPAVLHLELHGGLDNGTTSTVTIDFLEFLAVDSWMYIARASLGGLVPTMSNGMDVIYDADLDRVYGGGSGARYNLWVKYGQPIMIHPGRTQRFFFHHTISDDIRFDRPFSVLLKYRPRRVSL